MVGAQCSLVDAVVEGTCWRTTTSKVPKKIIEVGQRGLSHNSYVAPVVIEKSLSIHH